MNKDPATALWDIVKSLASEIEIYKEVMDEDDDSTPDSYILLRSDMNDSALRHGDGVTKIRQSECDIVLVTKGTATRTTDLHNVNKAKIITALGDIPYESYNLGYDPILKATQHTFTVTINYTR